MWVQPGNVLGVNLYFTIWYIRGFLLIRDQSLRKPPRRRNKNVTKQEISWAKQQLDFQTKFESHLSVCSFVASLHCVTQRVDAIYVYITYQWTNQKRGHIDLEKNHESNTRFYFNLDPRLSFAAWKN